MPWFGTDLRCGVCQIRPGVENIAKVTKPEAWEVAGISRAAAHVVSTFEGRPAYGGTPSDASVIRAIEDLRERGLKIVFYPIHADGCAGLSRGGGGSTVIPPAWTRRRPAATQVQNLVGTATPGAAEWSYRRIILHYAHLCASAGGVDAFLIGSELRGLTTLALIGERLSLCGGLWRWPPT